MGHENISVVVEYIENYEICECLLVMATSEKGDAETVTGVTIDDLS